MTSISIIIPTLNEAASIQSCLRPLQLFREHGHEVIIVDGGSSDTTLAQAGGLVDHVYSAACGRARQLNFGAAQASGDLLVFLHADTLLPEACEAPLQKLSGSSGVWGRFDVRLSGANPLLRMVEFFMNLRSRLTGIATGDQVMFVARDLFNRVGGFPPIELMEDISLSSSLKKHARPVCSRIKVTTSSRRWEQHGIIKTIFSMSLLRLRYAFGTSPEKLAREYE